MSTPICVYVVACVEDNLGGGGAFRDCIVMRWWSTVVPPFIVPWGWGIFVTGEGGALPISISGMGVREMMERHGTTCDCPHSMLCFTLLFICVLEGSVGDRQLEHGMNCHLSGLDTDL